MILVDSSVWIDFLRGRNTRQTASLRDAAAWQTLLVGDIILLEVLQGARNELHASRLERDLRRFQIVSLLDTGLAMRAAKNYRKLRDLGITIRKNADIVIGTFCIEHNHTLLHDDRDFAPMEKHLGLKAV